MRFPLRCVRKRAEGKRDSRGDGRRESGADLKMASNSAQHLSAPRHENLSILVSGCGRMRPRLPSHANHQRFKSPEGQQMVADGRASPRHARGSRTAYEGLPSGARRGVIRETATSRVERAAGPPGTNAGRSILSPRALP